MQSYGKDRNKLSELIEAAGGFKDGVVPEKVISGGPMMGKALFSLDVPATKGVSALLCMTLTRWQTLNRATVSDADAVLMCVRDVLFLRCLLHWLSMGIQRDSLLTTEWSVVSVDAVRMCVRRRDI